MVGNVRVEEGSVGSVRVIRVSLGSDGSLFVVVRSVIFLLYVKDISII